MRVRFNYQLLIALATGIILSCCYGYIDAPPLSSVPEMPDIEASDLGEEDLELDTIREETLRRREELLQGRSEEK